MMLEKVMVAKTRPKREINLESHDIRGIRCIKLLAKETSKKHEIVDPMT